jgi:hypothetical protein
MALTIKLAGKFQNYFKGVVKRAGRHAPSVLKIMYPLVGLIMLNEDAFSDSVTSIGGAGIHANVRLGEYAVPYHDVCINNGKKSGTYKKNAMNWRYQPPRISVAIPNGVISIGEREFADKGLDSVAMPNSVTFIGGGGVCQQ